MANVVTPWTGEQRTIGQTDLMAYLNRKRVALGALTTYVNTLPPLEEVELPESDLTDATLWYNLASVASEEPGVLRNTPCAQRHIEAPEGTEYIDVTTVESVAPGYVASDPSLYGLSVFRHGRQVAPGVATTTPGVAQTFRIPLPAGGSRVFVLPEIEQGVYNDAVSDKDFIFGTVTAIVPQAGKTITLLPKPAPVANLWLYVSDSVRTRYGYMLGYGERLRRRLGATWDVLGDNYSNRRLMNVDIPTTVARFQTVAGGRTSVVFELALMTNDILQFQEAGFTAAQVAQKVIDVCAAVVVAVPTVQLLISTEGHINSTEQRQIDQSAVDAALASALASAIGTTLPASTKVFQGRDANTVGELVDIVHPSVSATSFLADRTVQRVFPSLLPVRQLNQTTEYIKVPGSASIFNGEFTLLVHMRLADNLTESTGGSGVHRGWLQVGEILNADSYESNITAGVYKAGGLNGAGVGQGGGLSGLDGRDVVLAMQVDATAARVNLCQFISITLGWGLAGDGSNTEDLLIGIHKNADGSFKWPGRLSLQRLYLRQGALSVADFGVLQAFAGDLPTDHYLHPSQDAAVKFYVPVGAVTGGQMANVADPANPLLLLNA